MENIPLGYVFNSFKWFILIEIFFHYSSSVEHGVFRMTKNEHCKLYLKSKATQGVEKFNILPETPVEYEVTMIKFERVRTFTIIIFDQLSISVIGQRGTTIER